MYHAETNSHVFSYVFPHTVLDLGDNKYLGVGTRAAQLTPSESANAQHS